MEKKTLFVRRAFHNFLLPIFRQVASFCKFCCVRGGSQILNEVTTSSQSTCANNKKVNVKKNLGNVMNIDSF